MTKTPKRIQEEISHACCFDSMTDLKDVLRKHSYDIPNILLTYIASICDVEEEELLGLSHTAHISQARWLYWMALRYLSGDTYEKIAEQTKSCAHHFTGRAVGKGIMNIDNLIRTTPMWAYRWRMVSSAIQFCKEQLLSNNEKI